MNGAINVDFMTEEEIHQKLEAGYKDMESGKDSGGIDCMIQSKR
mgnify:CR=1 FL=1